MAIKQKSILGLAVAMIVLTIAAVAGGLLVKADGQTWSSAADTSWYNPVYTTFKIDTEAKLAGVAKLVNDDIDTDGNKINGLKGKILEIDRDMDLGDYLWVPIGTGEHPFLGTLISKEGSILSISGMKVPSGLSYQGLVGNMIDGTVGGFLFPDSGSISVTTVTYDVYAGAAVGKMSGSSIVYDITNYIKITTDSAPYHVYAGGIVGMAEGSVANSFNNASITANGTAAIGGIVGYGDVGGLKLKKVSNTGALLANGQDGDSIYAGGIAGHTSSTVTMNDEDTVISNTAPVTVNGGSTIYAGGILGKIDNAAVFSNTTNNSGAISIDAPTATGTYAGGLLGAVGTVTIPDINIAFVNTAPVTNNGGTNVHTGGIAGYADSSVTWTKEYNNATNVTASGSQNIYTGGFIGYAASGIFLNNPAVNAYQNTAHLQASGGNVVYTGGIIGYDAGSSISNASFSGAVDAVGSADVYTGGIAGYKSGGSILSSKAGNMSVIPTITSDGTIGGIAGYLDGTINNAVVKNIRLKATSEGGVIGGIAGNAQGTINGAYAGDAGSADYNSLTIEGAVKNPAAGADNVTAGGLVGINDKALTLTNSQAARVGLITESGKSGYTLGTVAGNLNTLAVIGTTEAPVVAKDFIIEMNADNGIVGGAVGINRTSALHLHAERIEIKAKGSSTHAGGIFGENHGAAPYVLAESIILSSEGADALLGGVAGLNTGSLTDATAHAVSITAGGIRTEAGGIAGRSEGTDAASSRASIYTPVFHAGELAVVTVNGADAKAGGLVGYAKATDIVNPAVAATAPDYVNISVKGTGARTGGLAGALENSTLSGDSTTVNLENLLVNTTKDAANGYTGGLVGYNDKSRLERLVGKTLNLTINGANAKAAGIAAYNLGTNSAIITNSYVTALSLKANATATNSTIGGIVGINDARTGDPVMNPGSAVSTLQNTRTLGSIAITAPSTILGGMVGENRSLIANNSITDKISVSSKGNNVTFGGLAGLNTEKGTLYYTYSNANLTIEGAGTLAGGLVGENTGAVKGSYIDIDLTGKATGTAGQSVFLGGLIGRNSAGTVEQSYTSSRITAGGVYTNVGGLIGELTGGTVKNSYVAKSVSATGDHSYAGGFIGRIKDGKVSNAYSAAEVSATNGAYAGGFAGRYDNASKELLYKTYYIKDESLNINKDLPDFAEGNHRWLNVHVRLTTILSATLKDRNVFPELSGWDFTSAWKYGSLNADYKYPEVNREANTGGDLGNDVNANINWYMKDRDAIHFQITSEAELAGLASIVNGTIAGVDKFNFAGRTIMIMNPIHIQSKQWVPVGDKEENAFEGTFNGGNHLIDGLTLQPVFTYSGLFGVIGEEATVSAVNLEPLTVSGNQFTGALAGINLGTVSDVDLKLLNGIKISGGTVGGVIGTNTGEVSGLHVTLDGGSRIETIYSGGIAGGIIGDNTSDLNAATYSVNAIDGSIGSSVDQAVIGGVIGVQAGNVTGLTTEVNTKLRITASGMNSVAGGVIGTFTEGTASELKVNFTDGALQASGLDSILGGVVGQAKAGTVLKNIAVTGTGEGVQLTGNGIVGAAVGLKEGALGGMKLKAMALAASNQTFDVDHVTVDKVALATAADSLNAVIGGIAGQFVNVAMNDSSFVGTIQASGETASAGGIAGQADNSILYNVDASPVINAAVKTGEAAAGGITGLISSSDINEGFDFGKPYPLYRGIYLANVHNGTVTIGGTDHVMDLFAGGVTGRNNDASVYRSSSQADLNVSGGKIVNLGGIAGYSNGIIVDAYAANSLKADDSSVYNVGGIVGQGADGEIHYSEAAAPAGQAITVGTALTLDNSLPATRTGGIVGMGDHIVITYSHAGIPVNINDTNKDNTIYAGGFAGLLGDTDVREGQISHSYATGALHVSGRLGSYVGGFAGSVDHYSISSSYASGDVMNTALDTRTGGFAAAVERNASISSSYALQAKLSTTGIKSATRSFTGGFAGYNDGTLSNVYANVPAITASAPGADFQQGSLVGYNFRDGKINGSSYVGTLPTVGKNAGSAANAAELAPAAAPNPLASGAWNIDHDTSFMDNAADGVITLNSVEQLTGAVLLYNETGLDYYVLYNRTATEKPVYSTISLEADIDLAGKPWVPFNSFEGTFDGKGHAVSNFVMDSAEQNYAGFVTENLGTITNVNFAGVKASAKNTGAVAGVNRSTGTISGVTIIGALEGTEAAGGVAAINEGTISAINAVNLTVSGAGKIGGVTGFNHSTGTISGVTISGALEGAEAAGGAAAVNEGTISNANAVNLAVSGTGRIGGITGVNAGIITASSSGGTINGSGQAAGGITGQNAPAGVISESVSYADVNASSAEAVAGGIAGYNSGSINNSYSAGRILAEGTQKAWSGGIAGHAAEGAIASSLNTGEVRASVNGILTPGQAFYGGIAGQKVKDASISGSVFNAQMLKENIAFFDAEGKAVTGSSGTSNASGLKSAELVNGTLPAGLTGGSWTAYNGYYPGLAAFDGTKEGMLSTAAVVLSPKDLINRVETSFTLKGAEGVTWSADPAAVVLNGTTGTLRDGAGTGTKLTVSAQGLSRSVMINEPAVKYPATAAAPELRSDAKDKIITTETSVVLGTDEPGGSIYYTLDGSTPNETSLLYTAPIVLKTATTVKAVTIVTGKEYSKVWTETWTLPSGGSGGGGGGFFVPPVKEPAITAVTSNASINSDSEAPVKVARNSKLKLTAPEGQVIYYTLDGSTPTVNSTKYTSELLITGNMTIKMITDQDDTVITIEYAVENAKYNLKNTANEVKYMTGYTDGTFKPSAAITRYELIASLAPLLDMENVNVGNLFTDVTAEYDKLTGFFASAGIIQGYPDGGFGGTKGLTRAEFAKIITTVLNLDVTNAGLTKQSDLKGHWSEQYVNALSKAGYVQGFPDGTFKPNASITRAEAVVMINRIVGTKKLTVTAVKYNDLPASHWAFKDIMSAVQ
ncbi:hypothetical protein R70331_10845 [Paenibacillus sp. FSL R7-0331]|nr:hypothetical protein R70331_10845 [Paenibacillus sp. FSL R7-0331]